VRITLDGGVEPGNIAELAALGARDFIAGGAIFYNRPAVERVKEFREAMP
jgi:pentose-5-phosphate-3-epimerase